MTHQLQRYYPWGTAMKIVLVTDAWQPQVNGVVRTWGHVIEQSTQMGHEWLIIHPGLFKTIKAPKYPEIQLAIRPGPKLRQLLDTFKPDAIHIATEGPLGMKARRLCLKRHWPFTTSYHTQFPMYIKQYFGIPESISWRYVRWFHRPASATLVPTASMVRELDSHGFENLVTWTRGVDTRLFRPKAGAQIAGVTDVVDASGHATNRPVFLYAGRVAPEKNLEAFLTLDLPGKKVVVGDGPALDQLKRRYPEVHFAGYQFGEDMVTHYAAADVFVFPSRTDTFGIVLLEAGACGLPVAAYPVTGPIDVVAEGLSGCLNEDLKAACLGALKLSRQDAQTHASQFTWERCATMALAHFSLIKTSADGSTRVLKSQTSTQTSA